MSSRQRTPDEESTAATTAVTEPPAAETRADKPTTFAERVGKKKWAPTADPFGISGDYEAGVRLFESKRDRQMAIKFEDKPSQPVIDKVKGAGYHWKPADKIWAHPVTEDTVQTTRVNANRLYDEVLQMIRQEKGIETGQEISF
jgi:hypothetical protein